MADPVEKLVTGRQETGDLVGRCIAHGGELVQIGTGDELALLGASEQQSAQVRCAFRAWRPGPRALARLRDPGC